VVVDGAVNLLDAAAEADEAGRWPDGARGGGRADDPVTRESCCPWAREVSGGAG